LVSHALQDPTSEPEARNTHTHLDCLTALLRAIYLVLKTASRGAEELIRVSSYIFWDSISSDNVIVWENLLFLLLALVGDQAPRKDDGTDFGCTWIRSNGLIALEIKCYCMRFVNSCGTMLIFWELLRVS
jgi:hypothetical protein